MQVTVTETPYELDVVAVDDGLSRFNDEQPVLQQVRTLCVFAKTEEGEVIGGAVARTCGTCCELRQLWVTASRRGTGVGRSLVQAFEQEALARGCNLAYLDTFSFHAPGFYTKLGYAVALEVRGFGPGISKYTMQKKLGSGEGGA